MYTIAVFGILVLALLVSGCTSSTSSQGQTPASVPPPGVVAQSPTPTAASAAAPFPNALALNEYAHFGTGNEQGKATVYRYEVKSNYNWTSPSWSSPSDQAAASGPSGVEYGYNMAKPGEGNTFLFIFVSVLNTGQHAVYAPSAQQFVVFSDGKTYNYTSVPSSDVIIDQVPGSQYVDQIGPGGTVGYILPGESNKADGYLIYEIPSSFSPDTTYVVSNLDYQTQAVWNLG